jgi:hypothetical protein
MMPIARRKAKEIRMRDTEAKDCTLYMMQAVISGHMDALIDLAL